MIAREITEMIVNRDHLTTMMITHNIAGCDHTWKSSDHDDGRKDHPGYSGGRKEEAYGKKSAGSV